MWVSVKREVQRAKQHVGGQWSKLEGDKGKEEKEGEGKEGTSLGGKEEEEEELVQEDQDEPGSCRMGRDNRAKNKGETKDGIKIFTQ